MKIFKEIEGINLSYGEEIDICKNILNIWEEKKSATIGFMYFANLVEIRHDKNLKENFQKYDMVLPDGVGFLYYVKKVFNIELPNLNGTDFLPIFIKFIEEKNIKYSFYGASKQNITDCSKKHNASYFESGYDSINFNLIPESSILFIGLGIRNHEKFLEENKDIIINKNLLVISVGGFFDFCSGNVKRAPMIFRKLKIEFLYRLLNNPKQHIKKNLNNFKVFYYIFKDKK